MIKDLLSISNSFAFIEGDEGLFGKMNEIDNILRQNRIKPSYILDVYDNPRRMDLIASEKIETLIIDTTGLDGSFEYMIQYFMTLKYTPKHLVLIRENKTLAYMDFYFPDMSIWIVDRISENVTITKFN